jgi:energy-coupling factor transporter transmembrane protein EcfT
MTTPISPLDEHEHRNPAGCFFFIIFAIIAAIVSLFVPCLPIWAFNYFTDKPVEVNLSNYICSALICSSLMALILFLNIKFNKNDEKNEQGN